MNTEKNNISLNFRSHTENHDTDVDVNICGDNVNDAKLKRLLNIWLTAIESELRV